MTLYQFATIIQLVLVGAALYCVCGAVYWAWKADQYAKEAKKYAALARSLK